MFLEIAIPTKFSWNVALCIQCSWLPISWLQTLPLVARKGGPFYCAEKAYLKLSAILPLFETRKVCEVSSNTVLWTILNTYMNAYHQEFKCITCVQHFIQSCETNPLVYHLYGIQTLDLWHSRAGVLPLFLVWLSSF